MNNNDGYDPQEQEARDYYDFPIHGKMPKRVSFQKGLEILEEHNIDNPITVASFLKRCVDLSCPSNETDGTTNE